MHKWRHLHRHHLRLNTLLRHAYSTNTTIDSVHVRCGSSGHVTVDLHNFSHLRHDEPILIYLPPLPTHPGAPSQLPAFLQGLPVASIRYRWDGLVGGRPPALLDDDAPPSSPAAPWPAPVHDAAFAYSWLSRTFSPRAQCARRGVYVYGSFLGGGLAASLALTEAHPHARFAVRGFVAYNGIYNWTMFLPDHRIHRPTTSRAAAGRTIPPQQLSKGSHLHFLQEQMPGLFGRPAHLFDAFASPSLLFHAPGLLVPRSFSATVAETVALDALLGKHPDPAYQVQPPRKSHLVFPPRRSTLKIPAALLLHDAPPVALTASGRPSKRKSSARGRHSFQAQAAELAELMRRSVDVVELRERQKWDDDMDGWAGEAERRVQILDVGPGTSDYELSVTGQEAAVGWLKDRDLGQ
ncbi:hypothetical protein CCM_00369 [Cordyceps militaris CM01]|uniref:Uncharacterized protein n=1 Tax=Cordyceps militaris (strain CM01) TaxID=983644 RepID=G3J3N9_CORMM|nr:uncharacterized protein CCM_00369 [Cordyceps militaris CM01]EGX95715.1 hypothetical protein CCM_00369 [Cordyceps militaris CM01]